MTYYFIQISAFCFISFFLCAEAQNITCSENKVAASVAERCQPTCDDPRRPHERKLVDETCESRVNVCICKNGYSLRGGTCVANGLCNNILADAKNREAARKQAYKDIDAKKAREAEKNKKKNENGKKDENSSDKPAKENKNENGKNDENGSDKTTKENKNENGKTEKNGSDKPAKENKGSQNNGNANSGGTTKNE